MVSRITDHTYSDRAVLEIEAIACNDTPPAWNFEQDDGRGFLRGVRSTLVIVGTLVALGLAYRALL